MKRVPVLAAFALLWCFGRVANGAPAGFSTERLARIDQVLQRYVDENRIAGAVVLVQRDGATVYERAVGWSDKEAGRKMTTDTIFRIASQTKAITSVAVLSLVEEGKVGLSEPVSDFIPSFANTTVATTSSTGVVTIQPARRPITIFDLLTHTAGISYGTEPEVAAQYDAKGLGPAAGDAWVYRYSTDVLGCVVERASGMPLDEFVRTRITGPLGMTDTQFFLPPAQRNRLAAVDSSGPDGRILRAPEGAKGQGHYVDGPRRSFAGGAGLLSTARDYARFLEMIRNSGALGSVRILAPRTVALMTTNQVGTLHSTTGLGFGLGFETTDRYGASGMDAVGSFGWGGAYASRYRVDPAVRLVTVLMLQLIPNQTDFRDKVPTMVLQALVAPDE